MSHPKVKTDQFKNAGGIEQKISTYATNDNNVLELENYDFQIPGAWNKRWGFTNANNGSPLTFENNPIVGALTNFVNNKGINNLVFTTQRAYIYTFDTSTKSGPGYSGFTNGVIHYLLRGASPMYTGSTILQVAARSFNYMAFWTTGSTTYKATPDPLLANTTIPGTTNCLHGVFGLNAPIIPPGYSIAPSGTSVSGGFSGIYMYAIGFRDFFGYKTANPNRPYSGGFGPVLNGFTGTAASGSTQMVFTGLPTPGSANIDPTDTAHAPTSLVIYRNRVTGYPDDEQVSIGELPYGATTTYFDTSLAGGNLVGYPVPTHQNFPPTISIAPDITASAEIRYLEVYASRLWLASKRLGKIFFSEILHPETIEPESNFDIIGNETDIMGLKAFNQTLIIAMRKGFFRLTGTDPSNFNLLELTKEYGCVSNNGIVEWNERLWFLDRGTIVEFNGSSFRVVSDPIQPLLSQLNYEVAEERVSSIHVQARNEIWFSVPHNSTEFNLIIVYDYSVGAFTTFKGIAATCLANLYTQDAATIQTSLKTERNPRTFFGSPGGTLYYFDTSFLTDAGSNMTCAFKSKYHMPFPRTATAQFRRLYIDPNVGLSGSPGLTFTVKYFPDYATLAPSMTMVVGVTSFQQRLEYGIPAKSLSVRVEHSTGATVHTMYGYGIEARLQRNV